MPATIPGTVISSSRDSQRNANPFNLKETSFNCFSVAFERILKRSAGKPIIRPSVKDLCKKGRFAKVSYQNRKNYVILLKEVSNEFTRNPG